MAIRRQMRFTAGLAVAALALAGCASQTDEPGSGGTSAAGEERSGGTIRVAETNTFDSFNPNHADHNMDINSKVVGSTRSDWQYINPQMELVKDTSFGDFEKTSDDPLTVEYNINDDVVWSDGNAVDKADILLEWAIGSGYFNSADGKVAPFAYAGATDGLGLTSLPEFSDNNSFTLVYEKPYVDWEIAFGMGLAQPAHVVADRAGMTEDELVTLIETAEKGAKNADINKVAKVWNEDFHANTLPKDPALYLSSGPMVVKEMVKNQSMTLALNDKYAGDLKPKVDEITVRFIGDASAQVAALRNGEVDIIAPQATTDTVQQVNALDGVTAIDGSTTSYDHLDLTMDSEVFKDPDVRKAFLMTIPRADIVKKLIAPMYADAEVLNSQIYLPSEGDNYTASTEVNGSSEYAEPDIEGAKALLNGKTPSVKLMYADYNPIRVDDFSLIAESARKAGFKIVDQGDPDWGNKLGTGSYDAVIFGWIGSGVGSAGIPQIFKTAGGGNYNGYSSTVVDDLSDQLLVESDDAAAQELKRKIDTELFKDGYGLPLYQGPGLQVYSDAVQGLEFMGNQTGVWWNFWEWSLAS